MQRRSLLTTAGVGLSATALGGCLATGNEFGLGGDDEPVREPAGPKRGESDAAVETEVVEDDSNVEYLEDEDAVRYVAYWSSGEGDTPVKTDDAGRRAIYETVPFEKWAGKELLHTAGQAAMAHVNTELDTDEIGFSVGSAEGHDESIVSLVTTTVLNRKGNVAVGSDGERMTPDIEFDELVAATPSTVTARYRLGGKSVERDVPMYAKHEVMQQQ